MDTVHSVAIVGKPDERAVLPHERVEFKEACGPNEEVIPFGLIVTDLTNFHHHP